MDAKQKMRGVMMAHKLRNLLLLFCTILCVAGAVLIGARAIRAASSSYCQVTYTVVNEWPGGFQAGVNIQNTSGSAWTSWTLSFSFTTTGQTVTQLWNGNVSQSGQVVTVINAPYNSAVAANSSVNPAPGFNGTWSGSDPAPTNFSVNGNPCNGGSPAPTPTQAVTPPATPTQLPTPTPTPAPTQPPTPTAVPTQPPTPTPAPTGTPTGGTDVDRYFPVGTPVSTMISQASSLSQQQVKQLIEQQVKEYWSVIQSTFGFSTLEKAYAFFLGMATRESTLQGGLETGGSSLGSGDSGSGSAGHSYGPLQAAETAYYNTNSGYQTEYDVPELYQYDLLPQNFYDIGISIHMGIRHLIHFAHQAQATGQSGVNVVRYALAGYNTGWVTNVSADELKSYSDEIGALAGWYLNNGHLYDTAWTWTGDPRVDRSNPWGWYP